MDNFEKILPNFELKIDENDYDPSTDEFQERFNFLNDEIHPLYHECCNKWETKIVDTFQKRLNKIRDKNGFYNEEAELNSMFPNRTDKSDLDGELDDGFSTDKYFGLE